MSGSSGNTSFIGYACFLSRNRCNSFLVQTLLFFPSQPISLLASTELLLFLLQALSLLGQTLLLRLVRKTLLLETLLFSSLRSQKRS